MSTGVVFGLVVMVVVLALVLTGWWGKVRLVLAGLILGALAVYVISQSGEDRELFQHCKSPPAQMTARQLATNGPGDNWHIILADYSIEQVEKKSYPLHGYIVPKDSLAASGQPPMTLYLSNYDIGKPSDLEPFLSQRTMDGYACSPKNNQITFSIHAHRDPSPDGGLTIGMLLLIAAGGSIVWGVKQARSKTVVRTFQVR